MAKRKVTLTKGDARKALKEQRHKQKMRRRRRSKQMK